MDSMEWPAARRTPMKLHQTPLIAVAVLLGFLGFSMSRSQEKSSSGPAFCPADDPPASGEESLASPVSPADSDPIQAGESAAQLDRPYWRQNLFGRFFRDQKYLFTIWWPSEFHRPGFTFPLVAGIGLAATSSMGQGEGTDLELKSYVQAESRGPSERVAQDFSFIGNASAGAVLIGTGYLVGRWSHNDRLAEASSLSAEALLSAGLYSSALKALTSRPRPSGGSDGKFFDYNPDQGQKGKSFPSGHATGAFAVATVFAHVYSDHRWVSWVAYATAGLVGASRVALNRHFPSDVIVGGLLGNSMGRMVLAHQQDYNPPSSSLRPYFDPTGDEAGLVWTRDW
jgi:membrane-associated phospholipid phosphatase